MPIGPKHRLGEPVPTGARSFTDREESIGVFEQAVSELPPTEYKVLVYYGVGGIGKTSLRIELCRLLQEKHWPTMWAVLDFYTPTHRNMETALFWLRQEFNRKYVVQFPAFDLANAIFWRKSRPQTPLRQDLTELEALLEQGTSFANLVSIVEEVPIVSVLPKLSKAISRTDRLVREWWTKRDHQELYDLEEMTPAEIADRLPMFWAAHLKDYMERESRPAVLFVDTYEALWEGRRTEGSFLAQDEWVRELVAQLPEVLWVITGRERVRWEERDRDWRNYLHQHPVGGLAEGDARRFLASCGVTAEALQEVIVESSKGVPFYLDLAVNTYVQIKDGHERAPSPSDVRGTPEVVLERFLRYLDLREKETLKVLSVARFWDRELFESLIREFNTGYPATALPELRRFSFVQEEQIPGTWTIHPLMREALQEHLDAELRWRVHRYLFDHYNNLLLEGLESITISDVRKRAFIAAFHHAKHGLTTEELLEWFTLQVTLQATLQAIHSPVLPSGEYDLANLFIETPLTPIGDATEQLHSTYSMTQVLSRTARLVILGAPGSGKTTLLTYLANIFARSSLQNDASLVTHRLGLSEQLLPIFIRLHEYEFYVEQDDAKWSSDLSFLEFLAHSFSQWDIELSPDFFRQHLARGSCILLLDGLDEVLDPSSRQFVAQTLEDLGRRYPLARIIVTSRLAGYSDGLGEAFARYHIEPLDQRAVTEMVETLSAGLSEDQTLASSLSESFLAVVFERPRLLALAQNPLLLSTMFTIFRKRQYLPQRRVDLIESVLEALLENWDAARGIKSTEFTAPEIKAILSTLAYSAQEAVPASLLEESFILSIFRDELVKDGLSPSEAQSRTGSLLTALTERTGILIEVGPRTYQFVHLVLQEYLASIVLSESNNYVELALERHRDPVWQEIIVFSVARVARTSSRAAEDVIKALLETGSTDGVLLAGYCLLEVMPVDNIGLQYKAIEYLNALVTNTQVSDNVRNRTKEVLARLHQTIRQYK